MLLSPRDAIERLTRLWQTLTILTGVYVLHGDRMKLTTIIWTAGLVPFGLGLSWVLGKKLLAGSVRSLRVVLALNAAIAVWSGALTAVLLGRFFANPAFLLVSEGWKLLFSAVCLVASVISFRLLAGRAVRSYCRA